MSRTSQPGLYTDVWSGMLDAGRTHRYFMALYERHRLARAVLRSAMIVCGGGSAYCFLADGLPPLVAGVLGVVLAGCAAWELAVDPGKKATSHHHLGLRYGELRSDYQNLWRNLTTLDADEIEKQLRALEAKGRAVDEEAGRLGAHLGDRWLNRRCAALEYETAQQQYA